MPANPLSVSEVHSSLPHWTSVIQVIEASHLKTTYAEHASKMYRCFVFADSHVYAVAFDDNAARVEALLIPFKKYYISDAAVEEIPRPVPPDVYRFFWVITNATLIREVFQPEAPTLPPYFDLTPFTSFQHFADSQISIAMMGVVLYALPVKESRSGVPSVVSRDYVVADQSNIPVLLTLNGEFESEEGRSIVNAMGSIESKPVIIGIRVRVKTDNYLSLCTKATSVVLVSPKIQEAARLEQWYRRNCSELMTSVLEKRYCNPLLLLPPVGDTMLSTISSLAPTTHFPISSAWIKGRVNVDRLHRLWDLACPYCFAPNNFIETLGISCVACLKDLYTFPRAHVKLAIADTSASISVVALGYEAEKLIGFTAYQLSQSEHEGLSLNLRVADALDGKELLCYVSRAPEFIRVTGISCKVVRLLQHKRTSALWNFSTEDCYIRAILPSDFMLWQVRLYFYLDFILFPPSYYIQHYPPYYCFSFCFHLLFLRGRETLLCLPELHLSPVNILSTKPLSVFLCILLLFVFLLYKSIRMSEFLKIADVKPKMQNWSAKVFVKEQMHPGSGKTSPTRYQKFVLSDSEGSRVQGILFNNAIEKMGPKLQLYKKYRISNAEVREIEKKYQFDGITIQWVISTRTVVEEDDDEDGSILPFHFDYIPFKDFPLFVDSKSETVDVLGVVIDVQSVVPIKIQSQDSYVQRMQPVVLSLWNNFVESEGKILIQQLKNHPVLICRRLRVVSYNGIALSTRNDLVLLIDPPIGDARQLKNWAMRNESQFTAILQEKTYNMRSPSMFHQSKQKVSTIQSVLANQKLSWVKASFSFQNIFQKYWYMSCTKCHRQTSANYGHTYTCNHCNERQSATPRCRFDVDLTDESSVMTASVFGELAEQLLGFTAVEAMDFFNKNQELPLELLHGALKSKTFIAQVKPGNTRDDGTYQQYTIVYYFEDTRDSELTGEQSLSSSQVASQLSTADTPEKTCSFPKGQLCLDRKQNISTTETQSSAIDFSDEPCGSSKTRVCLANKFELNEEAENTVSDLGAFTSIKKPRNA